MFYDVAKFLFYFLLFFMKYSHRFLVLPFLILFFVSAQAVSAATINVSTVNDTVNLNDGACSLREAINSANQNPITPVNSGECANGIGTDTVVLIPGTYNLSGGELTISSNINLNGNTSTPSSYILSGMNLSRHFTNTSTGTFIVKGLTLTQGAAVNGGSIHNSGSLRLDTVNMTQNKAQTNGGALYNATQGHIIFIKNSLIDNNQADSDNIPDPVNGTDLGGGLYNEGIIDSIDTSTISNNNVQGVSGFGGGIANLFGTIALIANSVITTNTAAYIGGVVAIEGSITSISNTQILNNNGGGVGIIGSSIPVNSTLNSVTITGNTAPNNFGGGVFRSGLGKTTIKNSTISNNTAFGGGGIANGGSGGSMDISTSQISNNAASNEGGGVNNAETTSQLVMSSVNIKNNTAKHGGGVSQLGTATLLNVTFTGNQATNAGGGMINRTGQSTFTNVVFDSNTSDLEEGGGLYNMTATATINIGNFKNNSTNTSGGAIYNAGQLSATNTSIILNKATNNGGGIYNIGTINDLNRVTFNQNSANKGGGIYNTNLVKNLKNVTIAQNKSKTDGGGISNMGATANFQNVLHSTIDSNVTLLNGAQIYNQSSSGAVFNLKSSIVSTRVVNAPTNCFGTIVDNGYNLQYAGNSCGTLQVASSDPFGGNNAAFNLSQSIKTIRLSSTSQAIDAADPATCPTEDEENTVRPLDGNFDGTAVCDIGAYEYKNGTSVQVSATSNPATANQPVTLTASLNPLITSPVISGTVTFKEGNNTLGTATVVQGVATLNVNGLSTGSYNLTATYNGDSFFNSANSLAVVLTVN